MCPIYLFLLSTIYFLHSDFKYIFVFNFVENVKFFYILCKYEYTISLYSLKSVPASYFRDLYFSFSLFCVVKVLFVSNYKQIPYMVISSTFQIYIFWIKSIFNFVEGESGCAIQYFVST